MRATLFFASSFSGELFFNQKKSYNKKIINELIEKDLLLNEPCVRAYEIFSGVQKRMQ